MWTARLFKDKELLPLQEIVNSNTKSSPFDIGLQQKERNTLINQDQEGGIPPLIKPNQSNNVDPTGGPTTSDDNLSHLQVSFINNKTSTADKGLSSRPTPTLLWGEELLFQMGKRGNRRRSAGTRKWMSVLRRPSLKRQPEYVFGRNPQQPSSSRVSGEEASVGSATIDSTNDSIIILSPADSLSVGDIRRSVDGLDSGGAGGGHYRSGDVAKTNEQQQPGDGLRRIRLFDSSSTAAVAATSSSSARSSNDTIDLVDDDDDEDEVVFPNPQNPNNMKSSYSSNNVIVLSDEDSKSDLQESTISTTSSTSTNATASSTTTSTIDSDCQIIAVKFVAAATTTTKLSPGRRRMSPAAGSGTRFFSGNGGRRSSLSYNTVKSSVDRARKRISSSNLARPSVMSHGIRKKKNKGRRQQGKGSSQGGRSHNNSNNANNNRRQGPEFEFITPVNMRKNNRPQRRATSPVFLLDRELGPNLGLRFSQLPSTSWGIRAPTFIPVGGSGLKNTGPFGTHNTIRQPSQPVIPAEPNFLSVSTNENRVPGSLRPIVVDGSNVAMGHKGNRTFSCRGIQICVEFFKRRGHEVVACVPQYRKKQSESIDTDILDTMEKEGTVKFTPSREVGGQRIASYDDRFIVQYAHMKDAVIISNDNFKDIYDEEPEWRNHIHFRILQFTWMDENCIMFPRDPMGRNGPDLEQFLRF